MIKIGNLEIEKILIGDSDVSKVYVGNTVVYSPSSGSPTPPVPMEEQYLTIEAVEGNVGSLRLSTYDYEEIYGLEYNVNDTYWQEMDVSEGNTGQIYLNVGDYVRFRYGENGDGITNLHIWSDANPQSWQTAKKYVVYGNLYSLLDKDPQVFSQIDDLNSYNHNFRGMFGDRGGDGNGVLDLVSASGMCMNAQGLVGGDYDEMFRGCSSLLYAPELPATNLEYNSYSWMFVDCSNLCYIKCMVEDAGEWGTPNWIGNNYCEGELGIAPVGTFVMSSSANPNAWGRGDGAYTFPQSGWTILNESGQTVSFDFNCEVWRQKDYENYEDCLCQEYGEGCPSCADYGLCGDYPDCYDCDPCEDWESRGYESYEECTCTEYGENCEEEGDGGEEEPEE